MLDRQTVIRCRCTEGTSTNAGPRIFTRNCGLSVQCCGGYSLCTARHFRFSKHGSAGQQMTGRGRRACAWRLISSRDECRASALPVQTTKCDDWRVARAFKRRAPAPAQMAPPASSDNKPRSPERSSPSIKQSSRGTVRERCQKFPRIDWPAGMGGDRARGCSVFIVIIVQDNSSFNTQCFVVMLYFKLLLLCSEKCIRL